MLLEIIQSGKILVAPGTRVKPLSSMLSFVSLEISRAEKLPLASGLTAHIGLLPSVFLHMVFEVERLCVRFPTALVGTEEPASERILLGHRTLSVQV